MKFRFVPAFLKCVLALGALGVAHATTIYLDNDGCNGCTTSGDLGTGVYATVTYALDPDGVSLDFTITLATDSSGDAVHFHNPNDTSHATFAFSLSGDPSVSDLIASDFNENNGSWTLSAATKALANSGTFDYVLKDTAGGTNGYAGGETSPLTFKITPTTGALSLSSVIQNSQDTTFSIDIVDSNGSTGNIWDKTTPTQSTATPEVGTGQMLAISFGLLAFGGWRGKPRKRIR